MDMNLLTEGLDINAVPDKFKDMQSGAVNIAALLNSYKELERKMSGQIKAPGSSDEYCIDCKHGMFAPDQDINARLHAKGMTQEQVQEVYDLAAERLVPMIIELASDFQADREVEKLISHFGGEDNWREMSRQLLAFGQKQLPAEVLQNLSSSYEGVLALHRMMKGEEPSMSRSAPVSDRSAADADELKSMMRDPKYWRDKDPAFVARVTEGFKKIYKD